jgi:hypothetical protein
MNTVATIQVAPLNHTPRAGEPIGLLVAGVWRWAARRWLERRQRLEANAQLAELWALADRYSASQPSLAADLRGAARRVEGEA